MAVADELPVDPAVHARRWRILAVLCLSLVIVMVGNSSLNLAMPALARDLGASNSALQWMVDVYALVFAGLLFPAGTIGDHLGRKRALQGGLAVFLVATALGATADGVAMLIVARGVMGAAAAFVMPSTLSILANVFAPAERGRAIALWSGIAAGGAAFGPTVAGLLLEHFWWGSVFLLSVPLVLVALAAGRRLVPESRDPAQNPVDRLGVVLSLVGVGTLVYAIIQAPHLGWRSPATLGAFAAAAAALMLFLRHERRARYPMLDLALFRDRRFTVASIGMAASFFALFGTWFVTAQYVQLVLGYSPLAAGMLMTPFALIMMVVAPVSPRLAARYGNGAVAGVGLAGIALGLGLFTLLDVDDTALHLWTGLLPAALGMSIAGPPLTTLVMSAVPSSHAGIGSAMNDTTRELGGALGVAALGSAVTTRFAASLDPALTGLPEATREVAVTGLPGALHAADGLPRAAGDALTVAAQAAYVDALHVAAVVGAAVVLLAAGAAAALLPRRRSTSAAAHDPDAPTSPPAVEREGVGAPTPAA